MTGSVKDLKTLRFVPEFQQNRMRLTPAQIEFIQTNAADDLNRLLLAAARYPEMDVPFLAEQIASRRQIKTQLTVW